MIKLIDEHDLIKRVQMLEAKIEYLERMIRYSELTPPKDPSAFQTAKERMKKYLEQSKLSAREK